ncbi:MAG: endo-1,4-beta-xylanase [Thermoguttaceae bacterium]
MILHSIFASLFIAGMSAVGAIPDGGLPVLAPDPIASLSKRTAECGSFQTVKLDDSASKALGLTSAVRCQIQSDPQNTWELQFQFPLNRKVEKGEVCVARFYARALAPSGTGVIRVICEKAVAPHTKSLSRDAELGREWKEYVFSFTMKETLEAKGASAGFHLGIQKQNIEIADFMVFSYGKDFDIQKLPKTPIVYEGQSSDAKWRKDAEERIEKIRKGNLQITVLDANGKPISDADVSVQMKQHAFGWGSAVVASRILQNDADGEQYRKFIEQNCSRVVFENDLKWQSWDNPQNHEKILSATKWLRDRNIEVRGHCLVWPSWKHTPKDLEKLAEEPEKLRERINKHIIDEVTTMKGNLVDWDVINEPFDNNDIMKILGDTEMVKWFQIARECDPNVNLYLNDYSILSSGGRDKKHQDHFEKTLRFLKENGAPITGLGMQGHFYETPTPPERMLEILDRFGKIGLSISITEFDVTASDETFQKDFTRDVLITAFSHPSVDAVLTWGFWGKSHWLPDAAFYRADWSITPAGQTWLDLVKKTWWTSEKGKTNQKGQFSTRGFLGDYEITVTKGNKTKTLDVALPKQGENVNVVLN